ncbi:hypothetical protein B0H63DRAFT_447674 [Podospora didyma]|uniref:BTB domain-containing protein n=1 Tax=Podospora didyma TaxID=330526 RepID=A0AAE0U0W6_9PEZI|nr:hypothetical protein B0H63DRAFT_447674 [Podospora didyma]
MDFIVDLELKAPVFSRIIKFLSEPTDATIRLPGWFHKPTIDAHRAVLSAESDFFKNKFFEGGDWAKKTTVHLSHTAMGGHYRPKALKLAIFWCYYDAYPELVHQAHVEYLLGEGLDDEENESDSDSDGDTTENIHMDDWLLLASFGLGMPELANDIEQNWITSPLQQPGRLAGGKRHMASSLQKIRFLDRDE